MTFTVETPHSKLGPSSAERWLSCPGSVLLTKDMVDPESWFAAEGTAAHTLSEWARQQNKSAYDFIGVKLKVGTFEFEVDDEMAGAVNEFVTRVEQLPGYPLYEVRVHYDEFVPGGFGTLDDARIEDKRCRVTDLKYGTGVQVFADDNPQLKIYAAGLYLKFRWLWQFDQFVLTVDQPRLNHLDEFEIKLKPLLEWMRYEVQPIAERAMLPGAPLKAGSHCQFCAAKRVCKVRADYILKTVSGEFGDLDMPHNLAVLTNDEIAKILPHLANVKKWCGDMLSHALSLKAKGEKVGDWKVVEGRSNRAYSVPEGTVICSPAAELVGESIWVPRSIISPAELETLLKKQFKGKPAEVVALLKDIVHKPKGKPTLVPGDDRRPEMVVDVTTEFSNLDDEE